MHCFDIDGRGRQCIRTAPPPSTTRYSIVGILYRACACYVPLRLFLSRLRTPYKRQPCRMQSAWSSQVAADLIVHGSTTGEVVSFSGVPSLLLVMGSLSGPLTTALLYPGHLRGWVRRVSGSHSSCRPLASCTAFWGRRNRSGYREEPAWRPARLSCRTCSCLWSYAVWTSFPLH